MSASEYEQYEKVRADSKLTMPGRLGVKESLHSMFMYTGGLRGLAKSTWFCLKSPTGVVCIMLVDSIRMDLSHQTVFLDAALFPPQVNGGCAYLTPLMASLSTKLVQIPVDGDETVFWKQFLPTFVERCRSWHHKITCEYRAEGFLPISTEDGKPFVCSCGSGFFPEKYLDNIQHFKTFAKFAVRVAVPVIFASPISKDDAGLVDAKTALTTLHLVHVPKPRSRRRRVA